jgi:hypothetical protein
VLSKLCIFSWLHLSFFHLVEHKLCYEFWVHPEDGQLEQSLVAIYMLVVPALLMFRLVINLCRGHHRLRRRHHSQRRRHHLSQVRP